MATHPAASGGYRTLLRQPNFRCFFAATSISMIGSAVALTGITLALLVSGYSASAVGGVLAAETVPLLLFMLVGGVAGDRWPRRSLMIGSDLLRCTSQAVLAILLATGHPPLPVLMALAACCGVGNAFYAPAESGLVPQVADASQLNDANSLISLCNSLAVVVGPALGGLLVGFGGGAVAIGLDAASYGLSAAILAFVRLPPQAAATGQASLIAEFRLGWEEFRRHRWLELLTAQVAIQSAIALGMFFVIGPSLFTPLRGGAQSWGLVISGVGVGGIAGGLLAMRVSFPRPLLAIQVAIATMAIPIVMLALHAPVPLLMLGSGLFGIALAVTNILFQTAIQQSVPITLMSRVNSFVGLVGMSLVPVGYALSGPVADLVGPEQALGMGAGILLLSVAALVASRNIREFETVVDNAMAAPPISTV